MHLKNIKYAEVAELLGILVATVKMLLVCSLKTLRGIVSDTAFLLYVLVYRGDHRRFHRLENLVINSRNFRFREDCGKRLVPGMFNEKFV